MLDNNPPENSIPVNFASFMKGMVGEFQESETDPVEEHPKWQRYRAQRAYATHLYATSYKPGMQGSECVERAQEAFMAAEAFFCYQDVFEKQVRAEIEKELSLGSAQKPE